MTAPDIDLDRHPRQADWHRQHLHAAVDTIIVAWPHAVLDAQAVGFPPGRGYDTNGGSGSVIVVDDEHGNPDAVPATAVEIAALNPGVAAGWVAQLHDTVQNILHAAHPTWTGTGLDWSRPDHLAGLLHRAVDILADRFPAHLAEQTELYHLADVAGQHWPPPPKKGTTVAGVTVGERGNTVEVCGLCRQPVAGGAADPIRRIDGEPFHKSPCWYKVSMERGIHPRARAKDGTITA